MQDRNPGVPAIPTKLFPPDQRASLKRPTELFQELEKDRPLRCLFSGRELAAWSLDHFVPWSYVGHDRVWNLAPVAPEVNSSKGDRLPHERYLRELVDLHARALAAAARLPAGRRERLLDEYVVDLRVPHEVLAGRPDLRREALGRAYGEVVPVLLGQAARLGFEPGWAYAGR